MFQNDVATAAVAAVVLPFMLLLLLLLLLPLLLLELFALGWLINVDERMKRAIFDISETVTFLPFFRYCFSWGF